MDVNKNLKNAGIKPIRVLYPKDFMMTNQQPDSEKIKLIAQSTVYNKTPISFDIEIGNRFKPETNLPVIIKTLQLYKQYGGQAIYRASN